MNRNRSVCLTFCLLFLLFQTAAFGQAAQQTAPDVVLNVGGEVERPLRLTASDFARLPRLSVRATDHNGSEATFEGVALVEVLRLAGVRLGEQLRGQNLANYLVIEAADRYRAVFALPELDPTFTDRVILLADRRDGRPLAASEGALRIIIPSERKHARWVRQVVSLIIRRA